MSQSDRLSAGLDALATAIANELQQLRDAIAKSGTPDPAIDASISRLEDLTAPLTADDPAPPA